jgi:hypothetical protein
MTPEESLQIIRAVLDAGIVLAVLAVEVAARCGLRSSGIGEDDFYSHVWQHL